MKTMEKTEYLKSVVEQHFSKSTTKPTKNGIKMLERGHRKTFNQIMEDMNAMKKPSDKTCALLMATIKAHTDIEIATVCKAIGVQKKAMTIINVIDTAYPDSKIAKIVTSEASQEFFANIVKNTKELTEKTKELRMIVKKMI